MDLKKILVLFSGVIFFAVAFLLAISVFSIKNTVSSVIVTPKSTQSATQTPTPTIDPNAPYGVMLLGYRGDNSIGGTLTDTMILIVVSPASKKVTLVSIPRDLWVPIPVSEYEEKYFKINAAHAIGLDDRKYPDKEIQFTGVAGGGMLTKHIVQQIFDIPVRYFISIDFEGFTKSIDVLGGVDVNVTKSFEDPYYPLQGKENDTCGKSDEEVKAVTATMSGDLLEHEFLCRYETLKFESGTVHMNGETALKFARSRHAKEDGSDFSRSQRQKQVMLAVKDQVLKIGFLPKSIPFVQSLSGDVRTDIPLTTMLELVAASSEYKNYKVNSITLNTDNVLQETYSDDRQYILIPKSGLGDWTSIRNYVKSQMEK